MEAGQASVFFGEGPIVVVAEAQAEVEILGQLDVVLHESAGLPGAIVAVAGAVEEIREAGVERSAAQEIGEGLRLHGGNLVALVDDVQLRVVGRGSSIQGVAAGHPVDRWTPRGAAPTLAPLFQ